MAFGSKNRAAKRAAENDKTNEEFNEKRRREDNLARANREQAAHDAEQAAPTKAKVTKGASTSASDKWGDYKEVDGVYYARPAAKSGDANAWIKTSGKAAASIQSLIDNDKSLWEAIKDTDPATSAAAEATGDFVGPTAPEGTGDSAPPAPEDMDGYLERRKAAQEKDDERYTLGEMAGDAFDAVKKVPALGPRAARAYGDANMNYLKAIGGGLRNTMNATPGEFAQAAGATPARIMEVAKSYMPDKVDDEGDYHGAPQTLRPHPGKI